MATGNKRDMIRSITGLPTREQLMSGANTDTVPAVIHNPTTGEQSPAALTPGEMVFSIPSILGAGEGNYHKGVRDLTHLHDKLSELGKSYLEKNPQGLAAAPMTPGAGLGNDGSQEAQQSDPTDQTQDS